MKKPFSSPYSASGFTLIELIIIIVILGILSIVATTRFVDFRKEAILASMDGMENAMRTAARLAYSKALIEGKEKQATAILDIDSVQVMLAYGYPDGTANGISKMLALPNNDWQQRASIFGGAWVIWHGKINEDAGAAQCYLRYRQVTQANALPVIDKETSGC